MGKVSDEIKQERPFDRPEREVAVTLLRTGEVLRHAVESVLRPWDVSPEQYNVLRILHGAKEGGHPALEIARRMIARSPNITRMIDKMVAKGLTNRERVDSDRRVVGEFEPTGFIPKFYDEMQSRGIALPREIFFPKARKSKLAGRPG